MEDGEVELVRVLQEGEMAHVRQDEQARVGNDRGDIFGMGAVDRLVVVAVDDEDGRLDRLELGVGPVGLAEPHLADLIDEGGVFVRRRRERGVFLARARDEGGEGRVLLDIVGWSDGAILGLDLAIRHPDRVGTVFAFAANTLTSGVKDDVEKNPTFAAFIKRAGREYQQYSATPNGYDAFVEQISKMWVSQPNWTDAQLKAITSPVLVVDGDHDEAIKREHTEYIAATIPHSGLLILPDVSHFAFLQDPGQFNFAILHFLSDE